MLMGNGSPSVAGMWPNNSVVGREVGASAVLEVAERLQTEALTKLEVDPESALVGLRQAFALQLQYGTESERLCKACAALCRALARLPSGPAEAVTPLLEALDTLDARAAASSAAASTSLSESPHRAFLIRELYGLSRRLSGPSASPNARLDELRAADRAYERLAQLARSTHDPLQISTASELVLTPEECYFQLASTAERIGVVLMRSSELREREAACFYLQRAARKLRLAGVDERDPRLVEIQRLHERAEEQLAKGKEPPLAPCVSAAAVGSEASSSAADACVVQ
mmetsp:Transcript_19996/g.50867  ORF Transcript_19996/g.50867 Transcript_19996/m.50867 type:complete len:286 (-) Transcript_19996:396-1253(-)|eukprot:CAMPEP_0115864322 /NCGR_PEP_ID=MMETSP0287-20121206/19142_1 /TAXON_ID=412157 /ORGANISM="Chrysochromulina rotalis, Strain UIO044" /LENGTH=285 /DNA_ID=CAMNT_0003318791 /DNA_START=49 /DNA_END=906 /DNA_ORIENTATION=-